MTPEFTPWPKIARLSRQIIITEKIDGTNASVFIGKLENDQPIPDKSLGVFDHEGELHFMMAGSRTRWITPADDNYGFAGWAARNFNELKKLGPGNHFGEWWGQGIQRTYGLAEKRFSLFNVSRWNDERRPSCCHVVPTLYQGIFDPIAPDLTINRMRENGSVAAPGFMKPEGIVVYHAAANLCFKKTLEKDEEPKGNQNP